MKTIITAQGTLLQIKLPSDKISNGGGGKRKRIHAFSAASRKRMFELFHRLRVKRFVFITLTYGQQFPDVETAKYHLELFIAKLKYRFPKLAGVWRIELQERGAPHFHLLMTYLPFIDKDEICTMWEKIIGKQYRNNSKPFGGSRRKTFTRIELCKSKKKVFGYLAKYVAKRSDVENVAGGFNSVAYRQICGKHWGIIGKENLPYAPLRQVEFDGNASIFFQFRRSCRNYYRFLKVRRADCGLTLFTGDAYQWLKYWHRLSFQQFEPPKANCFGIIS